MIHRNVPVSPAGFSLTSLASICAPHDDLPHTLAVRSQDLVKIFEAPGTNGFKQGTSDANMLSNAFIAAVHHP